MFTKRNLAVQLQTLQFMLFMLNTPINERILAVILLTEKAKKLNY